MHTLLICVYSLIVMLVSSAATGRTGSTWRSPRAPSASTTAGATERYSGTTGNRMYDARRAS